jgi:hypothetical protein
MYNFKQRKKEMKKVTLYIVLMLALPVMVMAQSISANLETAPVVKTQMGLGIELRQVTPNPLNTTTTVDFTLPKDSKVYIKICDAENNEVVTLLNDVLTAGNHSVQFYVPGIASGKYYYSFTAEAGGRKTVIKEQMIL